MKIKFKSTGLEVEKDVEETTLIEVCYEYDTPVNFGCRIGMCGTCRIVVSEGLNNLSKKTQEEKELTEEDNERLACQCKVKGDIEIE